MWKQLVEPNPSVVGRPFYCLEMTQKIYGAPVRYYDATEASNHTQFQHATRELPNVSVPVWFDMWSKGRNYGHVVGYFPDKGFLNVPGSGIGQVWLSTLAEVERYNGCTFKFWSEDINGLRVAEFENVSDEDDMKIFQYNTWNYLIGSQFIVRILNTQLNNAALKLYGQPIVVNSFDEVRAVMNVHGIAYTVWESINKANAKTDYAWSVERGFFNPEKTFVPSGGGGSIDVAAVAKAVNDDVAQRMAK